MASVLHVVEVYGGGGIGGAIEHMDLLFRWLPKEGIQITLLSMPPYSADDRAQAAGIPVRRAADESEATRILRQIGADVTHTHGLRPAAVALSAGMHPWVRTLHSTIRSDYTALLKRMAAVALERRAVRRADWLIAISEAVARDRILLGAEEKRVIVIPNAVPDPVDAKPPTAWQTDFGLEKGTRVAVILARLEAVKGVDRAVNALAALGPAWHLVVLGKGSQREALVEIARRRGVTERLHLGGYRRDARAYLSIADVVVIPSREEGLSLVALEALAAGRAVAAARTGGLPEALGEVAVYTDAGDGADLARAIEEAYARREELGRLGRRRYETLFRPEVFARRTADALRGAQST